MLKFLVYLQIIVFSVQLTLAEEAERQRRCVEVLSTSEYLKVDTKLSPSEVEDVRQLAKKLDQYFSNKAQKLKKVRKAYFETLETVFNFFRRVNGNTYAYHLYISGEPQNFLYLRNRGIEEIKSKKIFSRVNHNIETFVDYPREKQLVYLNAVLTLKYVESLKQVVTKVKSGELDISNGITIDAAEYFNYGEVKYRKVSFGNVAGLAKEIRRLEKQGVVRGKSFPSREFLNYVNDTWLESLDMEQAHLYRVLEMYKRELRKARAFNDKELRKDLEDKIGYLLSSKATDLAPPMYAMNRQIEMELAHEVNYYHGERSEADQLENSSERLTVGEKYYLGLDGEKLTVGRRFFRMSLLSTPLVIGGYALTKAIPMAHHEIEDMLFQVERTELVETIDDSTHRKKLNDYLEENGIDINLPFEQWKDNDKQLYLTIKRDRREFLAEIEADKQREANAIAAEEKLDKRLELLETLMPVVMVDSLNLVAVTEKSAFVDAEKYNLFSADLQDKNARLRLIYQMNQRYKQLKASGMDDLQIKTKLISEFI